MKNPRIIRWNDTTTYEDGTAFEAADFRAYELGVADTLDGEPVPLLALPVTLGVGQSPIPDVLRETRGLRYVALRTLDNYDQMSVWSNRVEVQFTGRPSTPSSVTTSLV